MVVIACMWASFVIKIKKKTIILNNYELNTLNVKVNFAILIFRTTFLLVAKPTKHFLLPNDTDILLWKYF
jgi:hypothetical protein